jgi:hypothetical protein
MKRSTQFLITLGGAFLITLVAPLLASAERSMTFVQYQRHHQCRHHQRCYHVNPAPMTISSPLGGGGEIVIHLRWRRRNTLFIESVSMKDVPAECTTISPDGESYEKRYFTDLVGSELFDGVAEVGGLGVAVQTPELDLAIVISEYERDEQELVGRAEIYSSHGSTTCGYTNWPEMGWTARVPHGWRAA